MTNLTDPINNAPMFKVAKAAFVAIDKLQDYTPAEQVAAMGLLLNLLCRAHKVDAREVMVTADNRIVRGFRANNQHVMALLHYFKVDITEENTKE